MAKDFLYTNGIIAASEKYLLKDKIFKLCETDAEEVLRTLSESGFGRGAEVSSVYDYEQLVAADEAAIDGFIREYSPSSAEAAYLLAPRDFHNAKAVLKAHYTNAEVGKLLAPEGLVPVSLITECVREENYGKLGKELSAAVKSSAELFKDGTQSGAEIGIIFTKAEFEYLSRVCSRNGLLKKLLAAKADMTNILTAMRSTSEEFASNCYVSGGKLTRNQLAGIFSEDREKASRSLTGTPYAEFYKICYEAKADGLPLTEAEKLYESYETDYFAAKKYDLQKSLPFLYYVLRRRAENSNVRILFVCLLAGMKEQDIKKRLRTF